MLGARKIILVTLVCIAVVAGVLAMASLGAPRSQVKLLAHAGAGMQAPLDELGAVFATKTGVRVDYSYKGSGCLLPDIVVSRKGDLYIPGELFYMQQAIDRGMISRHLPVAQMATVLIAQQGNPKKITGLRDLARPGMRVGLGDAEAIAIGRAARVVLGRAGLREQVERNVVMSCMNAVELGNAVKLRQLDAAIVWDGVAALYGSNITTIPIPAAYRETSTIPVGVLRFSKHPREAAQFMNFLASSAATAVFHRHGYCAPRGPAPRVAKGSGP